MNAHVHPQPTPVATLLQHLTLAPRQSHKLLSVWPLLRHPDAPPLTGQPYVPLAEAIDAGHIEVDELAEGASVPQVRVRNRGPQSVVVLFGEEILGAKQNRVANATFLVPSHSDVVIDVSCVEEGRWHRRSSKFESSRRLVSHRLRKKMAKQVSMARASGMENFRTDQNEVWSDVRQRLNAAQVDSPTHAYDDYVETRTQDFEHIGSAFTPLPGQVGFIASSADEIVGLEVIGRPEVFAPAYTRLLYGYAIDAVDHDLLNAMPGAREDHRFESPEAFFAALGAAQVRVGSTHGTGRDLRIEDPRVAGCALLAGDIVHLTAFPQEVA
jgi:hypothetical protein